MRISSLIYLYSFAPFSTVASNSIDIFSSLKESLFEIEPLRNFLQGDTTPTQDQTRDLSGCSPLHDGTSFSGMFYDEEVWTAPDISAPLRLKWDMNSCQLVIGHWKGEVTSQYVLVAIDSETNSAIGYVYDNIAGAYNHMHESQFISDTSHRAVFYVNDGSVTGNLRLMVHNGARQENWSAYALDGREHDLLVAATAFYDPNAFQFKWNRGDVSDLLMGKKAKIMTMANSGNILSNYYTRITTKNQIRVVSKEGIYTINRKYVSAASGFLNHNPFFDVHNSTGGGLMPEFSQCTNTAIEDHDIPAGSEVGLCCGKQCTFDTSAKIAKSVLCEIEVNDCYNPLLENCTATTLPCEHTIAEPEDQVHALYPSHRDPIPQDNIWVFFPLHDMAGGRVHSNTKSVKYDPVEERVIEGHHSIPFDDANDGNGKYEIIFKLKTGTVRTVPNSRQLATITVYSYSTNEVLGQRTVTKGMLPIAGALYDISMGITIADRHLSDIGFRLAALNTGYNPRVYYHSVAVKYIHYATLSPTPQPTPRPTPRPTPQPTQPVCHTLRVEMLTDRYPHETTWTIKDTRTMVTKMSGGPYSAREAIYNHYGTLCGGECVRFDIHDTANDGICCGYGVGDVHAYYRGYDRLNAVTDFDSHWSRTFCG